MRIVCQKCQFYYVTWEKNRPHGCKAYGFKSQIIPSTVVKQNSGAECSFYNPKQREQSVQ